MTEQLEKKIQELEDRVDELEKKIAAVLRSVPPKFIKWSADEDRFLVRMASHYGLSMDDLRTKTTKFYTVVKLHQKHYERTVAAVKARLEKRYFETGKK